MTGRYAVLISRVERFERLAGHRSGDVEVLVAVQHGAAGELSRGGDQDVGDRRRSICEHLRFGE